MASGGGPLPPLALRSAVWRKPQRGRWQGAPPGGGRFWRVEQ